MSCLSLCTLNSPRGDCAHVVLALLLLLVGVAVAALLLLVGRRLEGFAAVAWLGLAAAAAAVACEGKPQEKKKAGVFCGPSFPPAGLL